jgi:Tol biopolymer transport system component
MENVMKILKSIFVSIILLVGCNSNHVEERQITFNGITEAGPIYSPNGEWIAYELFHAENSSRPQIWIKKINSEPLPLVDNDDFNAEICWSPDSKWIAFVKSISNKDSILAYYEKDLSIEQIWKINIFTKKQVRLSAFRKGKYISSRLSWLAGTNKIAFAKNSSIYAISADGGSAKVLVELDTSALKIQKIRWLNISPNQNKFLFENIKKNDPLISEIYMVDNKYNSRPIKLYRGLGYKFPSWANDSKRFCFSEETEKGSSNIFISSLDNPTEKKYVTKDPSSYDICPNWAPDGKSIIFSRAKVVDKSKATWNLLEDMHIWKKDIKDSFRYKPI